MRRSIVVLLCMISYGLLASTMQAQGDQETVSQCADVSFLMQQNKTPYDFTLGGGTLEGGRAENQFANGSYADFWSFQLGADGPINLIFNEVSGAPLEFALYKAMYPLENYRPVVAGQTYTFNGTAAPYTLVVRRIHISDQTDAAYSLSVDAADIQPFAETVVQKSNGQPNETQPTRGAGILALDVTGVQYRFHPGAIGKINEQRTDGSQVYFPNQSLVNLGTYTLYTGAWTQNIALLGGDLAINNGTDRIFFLQNFAFEGNIAGNQGQLLLNNLTFPDDTNIRIDSSDIYGLWMANDCTGFKLKDGRSFVAATAPQERELSIIGTLDAFAVQINALDRNNQLAPHKINMSWSSVRPGSQVSLTRSILSLLLVGERELSLQSTEINFTSQPPGENFPGRLDATLVDQQAQVVLDWFNMRVFRAADDVINLEFIDAPRGTTTRPGANLQLFEALSDVIRIVYKPQEDVPGEERLLLPAEDSYLEIITPAGDPAFDGTALPDQDGFAARSLNNLGGECYPVTDIMPQANCAPNGHPNPANGNLWVGMTDLFAHGSWIDLAMTRSYNSRGTRWTGPFGQGWTTPYLLDYDVAYDETTSSRPVTVDETYRVSLDVRYAPRGLLTFISPTGSQHPFVLYDDGTRRPAGSPEEYRAITMPGWVITRASVRSPWELRQDDGLLYQFDRAGRILRYGYPLAGRMIEIAYPRNTLDGAGSLGANTPIFITDSSTENATRRLELYYNVDHQIVRSVLRDVSGGEPETLAGCDPKDNCFETLYVYDAGRLAEVLYSDGQLAQYRYDEFGRLIKQTDPYAPLSPDTSYGYSAGGDIASITLANDTESIIWRTLTYQDADGERQATVTDEMTNTRTYVYTRLPDSLRRERQDISWQGLNQTTYVLVGETSPLAATSEYEATPQIYTWENGLLMQANTRGTGGRGGDGRLSYDFNYTPTGKLYCISCDFQGLPELRVRFVQGVDPRDPRVRPEDFLPEEISFTDGSSLKYEYDDRRLVTRMTDRTGAIYRYVWSVSEPVVLESIERENDGVIWEYTYNTLGLMTRSIERHAEEDATTAYTVDYVWDALGRLTGVTDSQLGTYAMTYSLPAPDDGGQFVQELMLTDPIGSVTVRRYDVLGRLLESRLQDDTGALRRETYRYDVLGRLTEKANWVVDEGGSRPLSTTYTYRPQDKIDVTGLVPEGGEVILNGMRTEVTDPAGTQQIYIYDALDRLRVTFDETQRLSYYDYSTDETGRDYGLRITHYEKLSGIETVNVNSFRFDSRWQLIGLGRGTESWELFYDQGVSTRLRGLDSSVGGRTVTLQEVVWNWAGGAFPQNVELTQAPMDLNSRYNVESENKPGLAFSYDFLGRPLSLVDGAQTSYPTLYCPRENGQLLTVYGEPDSEALTCDSRAVQTAITTDMHGRVVEYADSFGTRTFTYLADEVSQRWIVEIQMIDTAGQAFAWLMHYNAAGDLVEWFDEAGMTYSYNYDSLGRLTAVTVPDQPEESFVFSYNDANRLTEMTDGLGRGALYNYNETDQVISQLNARTADALSFAYTPTGQLATVVSPVGNATTFLYEDPTNPERLTTVIDPTGNQHRYQWDDSTNSLLYTNPLNNETRYRFDGTGLLWRIDDPLVVVPDSQRNVYRSHEIHYDSDGRLTDWLFDVRPEAAAQQLTVERDRLNTWTVSDAEGGTNWSQDLTFAPSGPLIQVGDVRFEYDPLARLQRVNAGNSNWTLVWQAATPEVTLTNPFGLETITQYDALFRSISETVNETATTYTYTPGALSEVTLDVERPGWGQRRYVLSPGNARSGTPPTITLLAYGQRTRYIFNGDGLLVEIVGEVCSDLSYATWEECTDAEVPSWTMQLQFEYDADERPIRIIDQDGNSRTFAYDDADNLITYQTASGRTYNYAYDAAQRLTSLTSATGVKLLFGYDTRDNLLGICRTRIDFSGDYAACAAQTDLTDGSGLLESYNYDVLDRLVQRTFPSAGSITNVPYEYDQSGRLTAIGAQRFSYNTLDLLENLDTDGATYDFAYHTLNQVAQAGELAFEYDNTGRVISYITGGQRFSLLYSNDSLYSLQDDFGNRLEYAVDERGFLSSLNYNGDNLIQLEYIYDEHDPGINLYWNSAEPTVITSTINRKKETQSQQFDGAGYFTLFYEITPTGLVQRHDMTTLPGRSEGYVVVQGYDNDERPLTMRVTDAAGLQVLYTQTITYSTAGLRTGEQLQYADGTRVIKTLTYQDNSQLVSQTVLIIRPLQVASAAVWLLPLFLLRRRRGRILVAALLLGMIALPMLRAQTTQTEERYAFTYNYDDQGNLTQVNLIDGEETETCARFAYDGANRLTQVERGELSASYDYDAYDRVTRITDDTGTTTLSYQGSSGRILSVKDDDQQTYYMQTADQPAFAALDVSGAVTWLITDGRERIYQTYQDGDNARKDLWLFDPLGRVLTLEPPAQEDFNPCALGGTRSVPANVRLQSDPKGMVWDAATNVYFFQGRAYDAEVGRYIQRDPQGPDSLGNIYDGWTRQNVPTVQKETPVYAEGLTVLREAMNAVGINDQLTADAVKARVLPNGARTLSPVTTMTQNARRPFDQTVNGLANLPLWLQSSYNLPAPSIDAMGRYTMPQALAPGQGGTRTPFDPPYARTLPTWDQVAMTSVKSPLETFSAIANRAMQPPMPGLRVYDATAWMPKTLSLVDFWQQPMASVDRDFTPESVLDLLPRTLAAPEQAAYTLDTVDFLYSLPERPAHEWIEQALDEALPKPPDLPPQTLQMWEEDWFKDDLFGLGTLVEQIKPPLPFIPFYEWGDTPDWLHILK